MTPVTQEWMVQFTGETIAALVNLAGTVMLAYWGLQIAAHLLWEGYRRWKRLRSPKFVGE